MVVRVRMAEISAVLVAAPLSVLQSFQQKIRGDVPGGCNAARHLLGRSAFGTGPSSASHSAYKRESRSREPEHVPGI